MTTHSKPLFELTAGDLMCRKLVTVSQGMPLRDAAQLLVRSGVHGAPVTDAAGRLVGVLSMTDLARWAVKSADPLAPPPACPYQERLHGLGGGTKVLCRLPSGTCPLQGRETGPDGWTDIVCREPDGVPTDWQVVELTALPADDVRYHMTADPVTVGEGADLRTIARVMTDASVHRVVVTDGQGHPVGVVSGSALVAALVYAPSPDAAGVPATASP